MMKLKVYTIYDAASGAYMRPFFCLAHGQAMRMFGDLVKDKNHDVGKHPKDYSLHYLGAFQDNDAKFVDLQNLTLTTGLEALSDAVEAAAEEKGQNILKLGESNA